MPKHEPHRRLLRNYDKICPICSKEFYSKNLKVKYCSKECSYKGKRKSEKASYKRKRGPKK